MTERRDVCWYCGGRLVWDSDYDPEDFGIEGEGIVTLLHCTECGAEIQYTLLDRGADEEQTL